MAKKVCHLTRYPSWSSSVGHAKRTVKIAEKQNDNSKYNFFDRPTFLWGGEENIFGDLKKERNESKIKEVGKIEKGKTVTTTISSFDSKFKSVTARVRFLVEIWLQSK